MSYDPNNIFAKILREEIPSKRVYEDDFALAFHDIHPQAPVHVLVIPKGEYINFHDFHNRAPQELVSSFYKAVSKVVDQLDLQGKGGYRIITNCGSNGGQLVDHYHVHVLGGRPLGALVVVSK